MQPSTIKTTSQSQVLKRTQDTLFRKHMSRIGQLGAQALRRKLIGAAISRGMAKVKKPSLSLASK